jgi:hypothetical protein
MVKKAAMVTGGFDVFASELSTFFSSILVVGVAAERTICDEGIFMGCGEQK